MRMTLPAKHKCLHFQDVNFLFTESIVWCQVSILLGIAPICNTRNLNGASPILQIKLEVATIKDSSILIPIRLLLRKFTLSYDANSKHLKNCFYCPQILGTRLSNKYSIIYMLKNRSFHSMCNTKTWKLSNLYCLFH